MKPLLDRMIDMIVAGLSGKAKAFYELEFGFFEEVTSISGKLKPYIKKSKPEKKVSQVSCPGSQSGMLTMARQRSTRKWKRSSSKSASTSPVIQMERSSTWTASLVGHCRVMPK